MENQYTIYKNCKNWKNDPRKTCLIGNKSRDISWYYWNLYYPEDSIISNIKYCIHHIDGNHNNNSKENLQKMTSSEHTRLHSKNNKNMLGKHHSKETKKKISDSQKGKKHTEETKKKISNALSGEKNHFYGKKHTEESKKKISKNHKGMLGKKHTEETKKKMSDSHKVMKISEEFRKKLSEIKKGNRYAVKKIVANFIEYNSCIEAAKVLQIDPSTITYRIKTNKPGYRYL